MKNESNEGSYQGFHFFGFFVPESCANENVGLVTLFPFFVSRVS